MTSTRTIGVVLGALVCAVVIAGNMSRADRGLFTISWFQAAPWWLSLFSSATAFGSVLVLTSLAAYAAGHKKPIAA